MYNRHSSDHIRTPRSAEWDRSEDYQERPQPRSEERPYHDPRRHSNHHQYDGRTQIDPRFPSSDRQSRPPYVGPPRSFDRRQDYDERDPSDRPIPTAPFADSRRSYDDPHNPRRSQEFVPHHQRPPRYISHPHPYAHPLSRSGPSSINSNTSPSYHSQGFAPHEDRHKSWHHENHHHKIYDLNTQFNHGPPKEKSAPTQSVIFMGLPIHTDEATLRTFLEQYGAEVDTVTIIYDRNTGLSKRYGFARFATVDDARSFVEPCFPLVTWKEPEGSPFDRSGDGLQIKIDYSQKEKIPYEIRHREREGVRRSPPVVDLNEEQSGGNHSYNGAIDPTPSALNDGARDIGGTPTSILLLRGLDPITTEQEIATHLQHIPDPSQTVLPDSIRKVMLIKDRLTRGSWGYAFVQFSDVQIRSRVLTVTFAHEHSFHPVYTPSDWSFQGPGGQELAYWDDKAYSAVFVPAGSNGEATDDHNGIKKTQESHDGKLTSTRDEDADMKELLSSIDNDQSGSKSETVKITNSSNNLNPTNDSLSQDQQQVSSSNHETNNNNNNNNSNEDDFSDMIRLTCLLCQRQFKSTEDLARHNELSNLHKTNLESETARKAGRLRKQASMKSTATKRAASGSDLGEGSNGTKYTDRAAARREAFGQPDVPISNSSDLHEAKKARYEPAPLPIETPVSVDKDGIQASNVGSQMLAKMGWSKGEGLGNGTGGRVEPVSASQYTKGVGLGASTGTPVGMYDDSKKGFMEQVKDKTLQRFNQD
ncbi:uncharacterized protein MELLADRAFT_115762 [Melampsora larici-populina 98AG31]|uniref:G-patch domain-containing protein n=1 Tax=Melampsora larici-populina (strain 98AG31 / pathotype 3-4-7) TaxID=747676 RepID=F4RDW2_MELLP|nr:uncharacterized protein MELLADRAFT_115762 [Melampsora larici-populina 98AG31]EGG09543.1 hypothetical protein MELLADRAFT_115762 [Melampsora larici-populina 98AG31]